MSVHYRPEEALATSEIVGMAALLRWRYPRRNPVPVAELLTLTGANGMLESVGCWGRSAGKPRSGKTASAASRPQ